MKNPYNLCIGIDEVGRGAWAGPLVVAAVQLPTVMPDRLQGLTDSKKLSKKARERYAADIESCASFVGIGWVMAEEIDKLGMTESMKLACKRATIDAPPADIVIDGHINYLSDNPKSCCLIKADGSIPAVSAASIVAKVARDNYMQTQATVFEQYGFDVHVGYGTARHKQALQDHGVTRLHRRSFRPVRQML